MKKLWGGRFSGKTESSVESFTESVSFDARLWRHDIEGSIAHVTMLGKQKMILKKKLMIKDPKNTDQKLFYHLLSSVITPRPIALVSSLDENGCQNFIDSIHDLFAIRSF